MKSLATHTLVLLTTCASVFSSPFTVPLKKSQRTGTHSRGGGNRARGATLVSRAAGGLSALPITNQAILYSASIGVGHPATNYTLVVDTGSSNTFVGALKPYDRTSASVPTGEHVNVTYDTGDFFGVEYLDQVTVAPGLVITNQSIGDALTSHGFVEYGVDGIIGLGPPDLTLGTLSPDINAIIPTVMNNLKSQGLIDHNVLGVSFAPADNDSDINGYLTFGGVDRSLYVGDVSYVPVTKTHPAALYWGINITRSTCGKHTIIPSSIAGVVDTGTSATVLADDFFDVYAKSISGSTYNATTALLEIPESSIPSMQPLNFRIGDRVFVLDVAAQLIPPAQNEAWGGEPGKHYSTISGSGAPSGQGLGFTLGMAFMERYYAVFDAEANRVGFAKTKHTFSS